MLLINKVDGKTHGHIWVADVERWPRGTQGNAQRVSRAAALQSRIH